MFTIPGEEQWTVILNSATEQWGSYGHDPELDVVRVDVKTETLARSVETMRVGIDHIRDDSAQLTFAWERSGFSVPIEVAVVTQLVPKIKEVMAAPGDSAGARETAERALSVARGIDGELGVEYARMSEALLAGLED